MDFFYFYLLLVFVSSGAITLILTFSFFDLYGLLLGRALFPQIFCNGKRLYLFS